MSYGTDTLKNKVPQMIKLSSETKDELILQAKEDLKAMENDRQSWASRQETYLEMWDDYITPIRSGPWEASSNLHIPFTMEKALEFHARYFAAIFDVYPWFYLKPREAADFAKKELNEVLMQWVLESLINHNQGIESMMDMYIWNMITRGRAVSKLCWEEERETFVDVEDEMTEVPAPDGTTQQIPTGQQKEVQKEKIIYCGPRLKNISLLDFYIPGGYSVDDAPVIEERIYLYENDLRWLKKYEHFDPKAIDELLEHPGDHRKHSDVDREAEQIKDELEGTKVADAKVSRDAYRVIEKYCRYDIDGDGFDEKVVYWVSEDYHIFLGWNYLNRIHKSGRPPYYISSFIPRESNDLGLVELLYPINQEIDSTHNLLIDSGTLLNLPWFTVKESRSVKADDIVLGPGMGIPVDQHDDIQFRQQPNQMGFFIQVEEMAGRHGERLSISELGHGMVPSQVGPLATASGSMALLGQMDKRISVHIKRLQKTWADILRGIYQLVKENLPLDTVFRVTGEDGRDVFGRLESREDFCSDVDFKFVGNTAVLNKELEKQNNIMWLQTSLNPLMVQLGLSTPETIKNSLKDVARSLGKQGYNSYIAPVQTAPQPQSVEEEISFLIQGLSPVIVLNDDHAAKVQALSDHLNSPDMDRLAENDPVLFQALKFKFIQTIKKHQDFLNALKSQAPAQQIGNGGQMAPEIGAKMAGGPNPAESPAGEPAPLGSGANAGSPGITGGK